MALSCSVTTMVVRTPPLLLLMLLQQQQQRRRGPRRETQPIRVAAGRAARTAATTTSTCLPNCTTTFHRMGASSLSKSKPFFLHARLKFSSEQSAMIIWCFLEYFWVCVHVTKQIQRKTFQRTCLAVHIQHYFQSNEALLQLFSCTRTSFSADQHNPGE